MPSCLGYVYLDFTPFYFFFPGVFLAGVLLLDLVFDLLAARFGVGVDRVPALPLVSGEATISGAASPATRDDLRGPVDGAGRTF